MNVQVNQNERLIRPSDPAIRYTGRIDNSNPDAPFLIYVCSQVEFRVTGHVLRVFIENIHSFYENRLGVIINGVELHSWDSVLRLNHSSLKLRLRGWNTTQHVRQSNERGIAINNLTIDNR